jgi:hypothetical protein
MILPSLVYSVGTSERETARSKRSFTNKREEKIIKINEKMLCSVVVAINIAASVPKQRIKAEYTKRELRGFSLISDSDVWLEGEREKKMKM